MASGGSAVHVGVVMAGGSGERFWPLSRGLRPKQLLPLGRSGETMLAEAVSRLAPLVPRERVFVITNRLLVDAVRASDAAVPEANVIGEPFRRNTAGALIYMAAQILARHGGDGSELVMTAISADHLIPDREAFTAAVSMAQRAAERHDGLVTIGLVPTRPETGYGYIRTGGAAVERGAGGVDLFRVDAFHEKPNRARAEEFVRSGAYYWNTGMFVWRVSRFVSELRRVRPDLAEALGALRGALEADDEAEATRIFEGLENISIDFALMERARDVYMVRAAFAWEDVGSWPALERTRAADAAGNVLEGAPVAIDCNDCIVYNAVGERVAVGVIGLEGVVTVVTEDAVLVVPKDRAQDVRRVVEELRERGAGQV